MQHHWGHFLAVFGVFLAVGLVLALPFAMHHYSSGRVYEALLAAHWAPAATGGTAGSAQPGFASSTEQEALRSAAQEGARWSDSLRFEAGVWVVVLLVLGVLVYGGQLMATRM